MFGKGGLKVRVELRLLISCISGRNWLLCWSQTTGEQNRNRPVVELFQYGRKKTMTCSRVETIEVKRRGEVGFQIYLKIKTDGT